MQVTASSPVCRNTDPKALVSGNFLRMNFAGPRTVEGRPQTWWQLDLGPGCKLTCNYYTLRHDGSQDFLRNWKLQVYLSSALSLCISAGQALTTCTSGYHLGSIALHVKSEN